VAKLKYVAIEGRNQNYIHEEIKQFTAQHLISHLPLNAGI
jgi:hypothetical protein